jgi:hypothetical protein
MKNYADELKTSTPPATPQEEVAQAREVLMSKMVGPDGAARGAALVAFWIMSVVALAFVSGFFFLMLNALVLDPCVSFYGTPTHSDCIDARTVHSFVEAIYTTLAGAVLFIPALIVYGSKRREATVQHLRSLSDRDFLYEVHRWEAREMARREAERGARARQEREWEARRNADYLADRVRDDAVAVGRQMEELRELNERSREADRRRWEEMRDEWRRR